MDNFRLGKAPLSLKLALTSLLCIVGLVYLTLLLHVWQDTQMKPSLVAEGYATMEATELTEHSHKYLPYYALYLFAIPVMVFMFSSYPEGLKRILAVFPFLVIVVDVGSMWLIPYVSKSFSWLLWLAGTVLAFIFLLLYLLNMYDIWLKKT